MKTVSLDVVHSESSQLAVASEKGEIFLEMKVATDAKELRRIVAGISGPKRVVFEEGPLSGMLFDAFEGVADEIISADATRNGLIAKSEKKNDERDARNLLLLANANALHKVYVPPEPYRTLRSLVGYEYYISRIISMVKNKIKALYRRHGIRAVGMSVYRKTNRNKAISALPFTSVKWHMQSLYRQLDGFRKESIGIYRVLSKQNIKFPELKFLQSIPGLGPKTARVIVAWIVDPLRFKTRAALSSYAGLGLGQGWTNWKPMGRARASKRGQRQLKRVMFISARAAVSGNNALSRRYQARIQAGWDDRKAIRDIARTMLFILRAVWITRKEYQDALVKVPMKSTR